jgi:predicted nucleic acid-binding protein
VSVLDASAYAEALVSRSPVGQAARARIRATRVWHAPAIFPAEVLSAIRGLSLGGDLEPGEAEGARRRLRGTRMTLHPFDPLADRVWELRGNLTVYDAWYVALA